MTSARPDRVARVAKLIRMLASPSEPERLVAARALTRMDIHKIAEMVGGERSEQPAWLVAAIDARVVEMRRLYEGSRKTARAWRKLYEESRKQLEADLKACAVCGRAFRPKRADAVTCSGRCRVRLHRQRRASA
jgi:uncharacterized paraquat-inducible protein A